MLPLHTTTAHYVRVLVIRTSKESQAHHLSNSRTTLRFHFIIGGPSLRAAAATRSQEAQQQQQQQHASAFLSGGREMPPHGRRFDANMKYEGRVWFVCFRRSLLRIHSTMMCACFPKRGTFVFCFEKVEIPNRRRRFDANRKYEVRVLGFLRLFCSVFILFR